jgi:hypothetical protein
MEKDYCQLASSEAIQNLLGDKEQLLFSDVVTKVNCRGTKQERICVLTSDAIYNVVAAKLKCKRRITLETIVSYSIVGEDLVLRILKQHDYHIISKRSQEIIDLILTQKSGLQLHCVVVEPEGTWTDQIAHRLSSSSIYKLLFASNKDAASSSESSTPLSSTVEQQQDQDDDDIKTAAVVDNNEMEVVKVMNCHSGRYGRALIVRKKADGSLYWMKIDSPPIIVLQMDKLTSLDDHHINNCVAKLLSSH